MATLPAELMTDVPKLVAHFHGARKKARIFPPTHAYVAESVQELMTVLERFLEQCSSVTLSITGKQLYLEGRLLADESLAYGDLIDELLERDLASVTFHAGVSLEELTSFVNLSNAKPEAISKWSGWEDMLREDGIRQIAVGRLVALPGAEDGDGGGQKVGISRELYRSALEAVVAAFMDARGQRTLNVDMIQDVVKLLVASVMEDEAMLLGLSTLKNLDEYTFYHSVNVAILALLMGSKLNLNSATMYNLGVAAILHDIGKIRIPEEIINKPGALTDEEYRIMQKHPLEGVTILAQQKHLGELAFVVAAEHHAHFDLTGYPRYSRLDRLHQLSNLVSVVDVYDALTSDRSYRRAMLPDQAMQLLLNGRGSQFHPSLTKVFAHLAGLFPVGTVVELDSGECAVVCHPNVDDLCRPQVLLVPEQGREAGPGPLVDLTERLPEDGFRRSIVKSIDPDEIGVDVSQYV